MKVKVKVKAKAKVKVKVKAKANNGSDGMILPAAHTRLILVHDSMRHYCYSSCCLIYYTLRNSEAEGLFFFRMTNEIYV